jgi:hypothetical protein
MIYESANVKYFLLKNNCRESPEYLIKHLAQELCKNITSVLSTKERLQILASIQDIKPIPIELLWNKKVGVARIGDKLRFQIKILKVIHSSNNIRNLVFNT